MILSKDCLDLWGRSLGMAVLLPVFTLGWAYRTNSSERGMRGDFGGKRKSVFPGLMPRNMLTWVAKIMPSC